MPNNFVFLENSRRTRLRVYEEIREDFCNRLVGRIRIEDDLIVQESGGPFNLMGNIPIEADEIESIMND